jgi:hypothetical protein
MIAEFAGNLESTDEAWCPARGSVMLGRLHHGLNHNFAAVEVIDQEERDECKKN